MIRSWDPYPFIPSSLLEPYMYYLTYQTIPNIARVAAKPMLVHASIATEGTSWRADLVLLIKMK